MSAFEIYLIMILDSVINGIVSSIFCLAVISMVLVMYYGPIQNLEPEEVGKKMRWIPKTLAVLILLSIFIPNTKTALTMVIGSEITQNEQVQELPGKVLELINKRLDEELKK